MPQDFDAVNSAIMDGIDVPAEYRALGLEVVGTHPNGNDWIACRAMGRQDRNPSAAINVRTGRYRDLGGEGDSLSLWDFAVKHGAFGDWQEARRHFAAKAGVKLPRGRPPADPAEHIEFQPWNEALVGLWCRTKPGITPEAVRAAGGRLAQYRKRHPVIALPIYGPMVLDADPVGWVLYHAGGRNLPVFHKGGEKTYKKMKMTFGSRPGLMGRDALRAIADVERRRESPDSPFDPIVWKTEGPSDLLALWAAMSAEARSSHLVVCNGNGAFETPADWMLAVFAGRRVVVLHDADKPGEAGAEKWCRWMLGGDAAAREVRHVRLPYEIAETHGKDLRDWLADSEADVTHDFAALFDLARDCPPLDRSAASASPAHSPAGTAAAIGLMHESDDDPHRLANVYLDPHGWHPRHGLTLRYWQQEWWRWDGTTYHPVPDSEIKAELTASIKAEFDRLYAAALASPGGDRAEKPRVRRVTRTLVNDVRGALQSLTSLSSRIRHGAWLDAVDGDDSSNTESRPAYDSSHKHIAMANGILDVDGLLAGDQEPLLPHTPRWFSPVCLPYDFDPHADCPKWKAVLRENLEEDQERIDLLQEWAGYLLLYTTDEQRFLFLEGEGANGKSVYCAGIEAMLGEANTSHVPLETFGNRFSLYSTLGKLANIAAEVGEIDRVAEGFLKSFTAGDRMQFDRKGLAPVEAPPTARLILSANNRPRFADRSSGTWRRMIVMPFRREVPRESRVKGMDKPEWWASSGELPGIFTWAIAGLWRLRRQGFTEPKLVAESNEDYRTEVNPARSFLLETCEANSLASIATKELYGHYKQWCGDNGYRPLSERQFGKEVRRVFPELERRRLGDRESRTWTYAGINYIGERTGGEF